MNKEELVQEVSKKAKLTQKDVAEILSTFVEVVEKTVAKEKKLKFLQKQFLLSQLVKNSKNS